MALAPLTVSGFFLKVYALMLLNFSVSLTDWKDKSPKGEISFDFSPFAICVKFDPILGNYFAHVKLLKNVTDFW